MNPMSSNTSVIGAKFSQEALIALEECQKNNIPVNVAKVQEKMTSFMKEVSQQITSEDQRKMTELLEKLKDNDVKQVSECCKQLVSLVNSTTSMATASLLKLAPASNAPDKKENHEKLEKESEANFQKALKVVEDQPDKGLEIIEKYKIVNENHRFTIAKIVAQKDRLFFLQNIDKYNIKNQKYLVDIALIVVKIDARNLSANFANFGIIKEEDRVAIAKVAAENANLSFYLQNYNIKTPKYLVDLASLAAKFERSLPYFFEKYCIQEEKDRVAIAKIAIRTDNVSILLIEKFKITDPKALLEIIFEVIKNTPRPEDAFRRLMESRGTNAHELIAPFDKSQKDSKVNEEIFKFISEGSCSFKLLHKDIQEIKDNAIRKELSRWLVIYILICKGYQLPEDKMLPFAEQILNYKNPEMRRLLTQFLLEEGVPTIPKDKKIAKHILLFRLLLEPIKKASEAEAKKLKSNQSFDKDWDIIYQALKSKAYKDSSIKEIIVSSFYNLQKNKTLHSFQKTALLKLILYTEKNKKGEPQQKQEKELKEKGESKLSADQLLQILNAIIQSNQEGLLVPGEQERKEKIEKETQSEPLLIITRKNELPAILKTVFTESLALSQIEDFQKKIAETIESNKVRNKNALFIYAAILGTLNNNEKGRYLETLKALVIAVLEGKYEECRYKITAGSHLEKVFFKREDLQKAWRTGASLKVKDFLKETDRKGEKKPEWENWDVVDTDHWEDMLLIGTEVKTCLRIGNPLNKCLLAYIVDGKNRAIVLKNEKGEIVARRIMRILWDEKLQQPVIYQEKLYINLGLSKEAVDAIDTMCLLRAKEFGLTLVTTCPDENNPAPYPNRLKSLGSPAPVEYVDAGEETVYNNGIFSIEPNNMTVVYSPQNSIF